ncbi:MAG: prepilin peptidase [Gammaproteobacteria bacterium]
MTEFAVFADYPCAFILVMGLFGLCIGSFLNVVIHRLPKMMEAEWRSQCAELNGARPPESAERLSLSTPRSRCPNCGRRLSVWENIPILSYVVQQGRCRGCRATIALRYAIVEALGGTAAAIAAWRFGLGTEAILAAVLSWGLIALSFIDLDTQFLPDSITLALLWLGIAANLFGQMTSLEASVIGAMAGYLSLWLIYHAFRIVTGKEGMGYGDFKLLAMLGAWLGWQSLPLVIMGSSLVGAVAGIALILFGGHERSKPIPFGPYLACAGWVALIWGGEIIDSYFRWLPAP